MLGWKTTFIHTGHFFLLSQFPQSKRTLCCLPASPSALKSDAVSSPQEDSKGPVLRSSLQGRKGLGKLSGEEGEGQPQAKKKKIDLIFKDVVEASLEACKGVNTPMNSSLSLKRTRSLHAPHYYSLAGTLAAPSGKSFLSQEDSKAQCLGGGHSSSEQADIDFNLHKLKSEENHIQVYEGPSTSFCPNCVRLKRRIRELEAEVSRLRAGEHMDALAPPLPEQAPLEDFQGRSGERPPSGLKRFLSCVVKRNLLCCCVMIYKSNIVLLFFLFGYNTFLGVVSETCI